MSVQQTWSIPGSGGQTILGATEEPTDAPLGVILIAHGFKGYKDYGMFPRIARAMAQAGLVAHRFNFSHSGMTDCIETFERPDLFERDTWNRQVEDLLALVQALQEGQIAGRELPLVLFGHSRGGVAALLTAGRHAGEGGLARLAGLVTASAPSRCNSLTDEQEAELVANGFLESPSARTGQALRIGRAFLQEQIDDPPAHDLRTLVARITCPLLIIHGTEDPTVPVTCADEIAGAASGRATVHRIDGADHVFNTPNPLPPEEPSSPQLARMLDSMSIFAREVCGGG